MLIFSKEPSINDMVDKGKIKFSKIKGKIVLEESKDHMVCRRKRGGGMNLLEIKPCNLWIWTVPD